MSGHNNERSPVVTQIFVGTMATSSSKVMPGIYFRKRSRIKNVWFVDQAGFTGSGTNNITVTLQDSGSVAYAALNMSSTTVVANFPTALLLSTPVGDTANQPEADVPAGTMLNVKVVGLGTGVPTLAQVLVEYYPL